VLSVPDDRLRIEGLRSARLGPFALSVAAGECIVITGRSGAGKSLLLRMIADLDLNEGEAWLDGHARSAMTGPQWRRQVVYCAAESGWWHVDVGAHFASPPPLALAQAFDLAPAIFGQQVRLCSTGERQRLSLVRVLALESPVVLLDEPTGPLDPESVGRVETLLRERLQGGAAIVMVTHDPAQADRIADRRFVMADGRMTAA